MPRLLHSICVQEHAVAADTIETQDLAVNPLSMVLINMRPLNDNAGTAVNGMADYFALASAFNRVSILHNGSPILSMRGEDCAAMAYFRNGCVPVGANELDTDNDRRSCVLPLFLGRWAYDPKCCFPSTRRGELTLELDIDVADTGYDTFRYSVETVELLDAQPTEFERKVQVSQTFAATGDVDVDLPIGNLLRGVLLFGTTAFTGAAPAPSWGRVSLQVNNEPAGYSATDFETALMLTQLLGRQPMSRDRHTHRVDATAASAIQQTGRPINLGMGGWQNYCWLELDPTRDDTFSVDTSKASRVNLHAIAETADAVRAIAVERMKV